MNTKRKRSVKTFPDIKDWMKKEEKKDKSLALHMNKFRLRIAIVKAIKKARENAGMTQAQLAKALSVPQPLIGRLEGMKDTRLPELPLLFMISHVTKKRLKIKEDDYLLEVASK